MSLSRYLPVDFDASVVPEDDVDATKFIATALVIRALRAANLHHVLAGAPCTFAIIGVDATAGEIVADAARDLLKRRGRRRPGSQTAVHDHTATARRTTWTLDGLVENLQDGTRLCCIYDGADMVPPALAQVADGIVALPAPDARLIEAAAMATVGKVPSRRELEVLAGLPLPLLAIALKAGRSLAQGTALALRVSTASLAEEGPKSPSLLQNDAAGDGPTLDDLHGLGEAGEWGRSLAADLADYRDGLIGWSDVDRGALVSGPPGTGKTTFALALGRTCGVPVFVHSFARWQAAGHLNDMLKAMRGAFAAAMAAAPCILFIDEVDSVGDRARTGDHNASYMTQVVNAFLECLDGAEERTGVVVVGATNHADQIDPAVRRSGRLDRDVRIPLPDMAARVGILAFHLRGCPAVGELASIAERLEGSSGADLERLVRDARRLARRARRGVSLADLEASLPPRERMSDALFRRACIHEAAHFVFGHALATRSGNVPTVARVSRDVADGSAGSTQFKRLEGFDRTRDSYFAELCVLLAGGAAEEEILGNRGTGSGGGAGSDLHQATALATAMVGAYGLEGDLVHRFDPFGASATAYLSNDVATARSVGRLLRAADRAARLEIRGILDDISVSADLLGRFGRLDRPPSGYLAMREETSPAPSSATSYPSSNSPSETAGGAPLGAPGGPQESDVTKEPPSRGWPEDDAPAVPLPCRNPVAPDAPSCAGEHLAKDSQNGAPRTANGAGPGCPNGSPDGVDHTSRDSRKSPRGVAS